MDTPLLAGEYLVVVLDPAGKQIASGRRRSLQGYPQAGEELFISLRDDEETAQPELFVVERVQHRDMDASRSSTTYTYVQVFVRQIPTGKRVLPGGERDDERVPALDVPIPKDDNTPVTALYLPAPLVAWIVAEAYGALWWGHKKMRNAAAELVRGGEAWALLPNEEQRLSRRGKRFGNALALWAGHRAVLWSKPPEPEVISFFDEPEDNKTDRDLTVPDGPRLRLISD